MYLVIYLDGPKEHSCVFFINICGIVCYFVVAVATTAAAADNGRPNQSIKRIETNKGENFMLFFLKWGVVFMRSVLTFGLKNVYASR